MNSIQKLQYLIRTEVNFRSLKGASISGIDRGLLPQIDDSIPYARKRVIVGRIVDAYRKAKRAQQDVPSAYRPGHKWAPQIAEERRDFIRTLNEGDTEALIALFDNFFRNNGSRSILKYMRYSRLAGSPGIKSNMAKKELAVRLSSDVETWKAATSNRTCEALFTPMIGNPYGCFFDDVLVTPAACPANYYAFRMTEVLDGGTRRIVAEIGGGIGTVGYFIIKDNPGWKYIDLDLPEVLVIAQYYLLSAFPERRTHLFGEDGSQGFDPMVLTEHDIVLLPNFVLPALETASVDLFCNFHSLSEMDAPTIEEYLGQVARVTKAFFFHENSESPRDIGYGKTEVPSSEYPIDGLPLELVHRRKAIWSEPRYWEYLYRKTAQ